MKRDEKPELKIKIRGLDEGVHPVEIRMDASVLELPAFSGELVVHGTLEKRQERLILDVVANMRGAFECTRCTDPFTRLISAHSRLEFMPPSLTKGDMDDEDTHVYDPIADAYIVFTEDIRDAVVLAIPMKNLCRENCKGLCQTCGKNLNREECDCLPAEIDNQWSALKGLQERLRAEENKRTDDSE